MLRAGAGVLATRSYVDFGYLQGLGAGGQAQAGAGWQALQVRLRLLRCVVWCGRRGTRLGASPPHLLLAPTRLNISSSLEIVKI